MRATRGIALAGLCCFLMMACASGGSAVRPETYVVVPHDTLYSIAWRHDLDYRDLARWNNIGSDYRLSVGQVLTLRPTGRAAPSPTAQNPPRSAPGASAAPQPAPPKGAATGPSIAGPPAAGSPAARSPAARSPAAPPPTAPAAKAPMDPAALQARWVWPTDPLSPPRPVPGGGILLLGQLGQDIRAASAGRVVYTGSGLRGYGNLVIIKHGETLLSSYAHNRELLVNEGQEVAAGQLIAHMGMGPHQVSALYFEIRVNGKPIDPSPYLPAVK